MRRLLGSPFMRVGWQRSDWWLVALFFACLFAGYFFAELTSDVLEGDLREIDRTVRELVLTQRQPVVMSLLGTLSWLAQEPYLVLIAAIGGYAITRSFTLVALILLCGLANQEMVSGLKDIFGRIRPETGNLAKDSLSFPSGHASGTAAVATLMGFVSLRYRRYPRIIIPVLAVVTILMGLSRMFLDMHWFSDVVGGIFIGGAMGFLFAILHELLQIRVRARRPRDAATASPSATAGESSST